MPQASWRPEWSAAHAWSTSAADTSQDATTKDETSMHGNQALPPEVSLLTFSKWHGALLDTHAGSSVALSMHANSNATETRFPVPTTACDARSRFFLVRLASVSDPNDFQAVSGAGVPIVRSVVRWGGAGTPPPSMYTVA